MKKTEFENFGPKIAVDELRVHTLVQMVLPPRIWLFCVVFAHFYDLSVSTSCPQLLIRHLKIFKGPGQTPPVPQQTRPIKGGVYILSKTLGFNLNQWISSVKKWKKTEFENFGPKIPLDELRVHTLVQMVLPPRIWLFCVVFGHFYDLIVTTSCPQLPVRGSTFSKGPGPASPRSRNSPAL